MSLPDFVIIGAMKCGTTTLAAQLGAQPGIFLTTPKEPNFFSDDEIYARGLDWYQSLFGDAPPGAIKGEASTHYTKLPDHPKAVERLKSSVPRARFVYMIRNPVSRAASHYMHGWSEKRMTGDFRHAFETFPELVNYGRFGMQIAPYVDAFGLDNICLTSLELLTADPRRELQRIASFVGQDSPVEWDSEDQARNTSVKRYRRMPMHGLLIDSWPARTLRRNLVPKSLRRWVRGQRSMTQRPEIPPDVRAKLESVFAVDRDVLAGFFPEHPALKAAYPFLETRSRAG
jgi:hypothetical protein